MENYTNTDYHAEVEDQFRTMDEIIEVMEANGLIEEVGHSDFYAIALENELDLISFEPDAYDAYIARG